MSEIIKLFLKLGTLGFGGPIALIGFMEEECVRRRKWMSIEAFQKIVALAKLFPGPLATLVAVRIGKLRGGIRGGIAAGLALVLPAFLMIIGLAKLSTSLDHFSILTSLWLGLTLAALALATNASLNLTAPLFKNARLPRPILLLILLTAGGLTFQYPRYEALFIISFGLIGFISNELSRSRLRELASFGFFLFLFWSCLKASLFTFGSGIAIVPVLKAVFIDEHHWLSEAEFLRGLTLAQITPGPLIILSTYLGFAVSGFTGACVSTFGTFLPTFFFGNYFMPKVEDTLLQSERVKHFFSWLLPAVCGAIFGSLIRLIQISVEVQNELILSRFGLLLVLIAVQIRFKLSPLLLFALGGVFAYLI